MNRRLPRAFQIKCLLRLLADHKQLRSNFAAWRPLWTLIGVPRYTPTFTHILGPEFSVVDSASFLSAYAEIFAREIYRFNANRPDPTIIDCGANVGVSICYFKRLYPASIITAFEPDPAIFQALTHNVHTFGFQSVTVHNKAVWDCATTLDFHAEGADAGRVRTQSESAPATKVTAVPLRNYLDTHIDFLKIDIEGAETRVLTSCQDHLHNVERLFVEYHSFANEPQTLDTLISLLSAAGFRLNIHAPPIKPHPFIVVNDGSDLDSGMDFRLNIFAHRETTA